VVNVVVGLSELRGKDMAHVELIVGGVIPPDDVGNLRAMGADSVFTPGTTRQKILDDIKSLFR